MTKLELCRSEIDAIDKTIIELYEKRMNIIKAVIEYKISNNIPIEDTNREAEMLEQNLKKISKNEYKKYYGKILTGFLTASKEMQNDILKKNNK